MSGQVLVSLQVRGRPAPQGSKRHVGGGRLVEMSKAVGPWREAIRGEAQQVMLASPPIARPVLVYVRFYLPRPAGHTGRRGLKPSVPLWPGTLPDLDKLVRSTLDGLVMGGVLADDKWVTGLDAAKVYADEEPAGAWIMIEEMS